MGNIKSESKLQYTDCFLPDFKMFYCIGKKLPLCSCLLEKVCYLFSWFCLILLWVNTKNCFFKSFSKSNIAVNRKAQCSILFRFQMNLESVQTTCVCLISRTWRSYHTSVTCFFHLQINIKYKYRMSYVQFWCSLWHTESLCVEWTRPIWFGWNNTLHQQWWTCTTGQSWPALQEKYTFSPAQDVRAWQNSWWSWPHRQQCCHTSHTQAVPMCWLALEVPFILHERMYSPLAPLSVAVAEHFRSSTHYICQTQTLHQIQRRDLAGNVKISAVLPGVSRVSCHICFEYCRLTYCIYLCHATYW